MNSAISWDSMPCSWVEFCRLFRDIHCLSLRSRRVFRGRNRRGGLLSCCFLSWLTLPSWRWRLFIPSKASKRLHNITFQMVVQKTPWLESAIELYQPSYRRLLAKLVPTFVDRGVSRSQRDGSLRPYYRLSKPEQLLFLSSSSSVLLTRLSGPRSRTTFCQKIW
jgi:hypothetical protein